MRSLVGTLLVTITCIVSVYSLKCIQCENSNGTTCPEKTETTQDCLDSNYQCGISYLAELRGNKENIRIVKGCIKQEECTEGPAVISNSNVTVAFGVECCGSKNCTVRDTFIDKLFKISSSKTTNKHTCSSCFSESNERCQPTEQRSCHGNETRCGRIIIDFGGSKNYLSIRGCANPEFCSQKLVNSNFTSLIKEKDCNLQCTHCENSAGLTCLEKTEKMMDCPDSEYQCATSYFVERRGEKTTNSWSYKGCKKTNECTSLATISNPNASVAFGVACCGNNSCPIPDNLFPISKTENNQTCTSCNSNSLFQCHSKEKIKCYGNETKCGRIVIDSHGAVGEDWSMRGCANQEFCSSELVSPGAKFNIMFSEKHCTDSGSTQKLSVLILTVAVFWTLLF